MYKRLSEEEKTRVVKKMLSGESVSIVSREYGVSRTIIYKWIKIYNKNINKNQKRSFFESRRLDKRSLKRLDKKTEKKIIALSIKNPFYSPLRIAELAQVSAHGAWNVLRRNNLNTRKKREQYIKKNGRGLIKDRSKSEKIAMIKIYESGKKISDICRSYGVSRTIFYKWLRRYHINKNFDELDNLRPRGEKHWKFVPGSIELVSAVVRYHPEYSAQKISKVFIEVLGHKILSPHGVHNVLRQLNLTNYQRRLAYANSRIQEKIITPMPILIDVAPPVFGKIPSLSSIPPPSYGSRIFSSAKLFLFSFFFSVLLSSVFFIVIRLILEQEILSSKIGILFSFTSLLFGTLFFLYSLKYYITIAVVLSFSRRTPSTNALEENGQSFLEKLFGISIEIANRGSPETLGRLAKPLRAGGLQPDLADVYLERKPFVSIHLATYNEKRVVDRLLTSATSMEYPSSESGQAGYEVIVVDDSTDETTEIISNIKNQISKRENAPLIKHIHRDTREGFKGGALREALAHTDPKAEFVIVFDADFIPYPDTITQFLKYFQSLCGTLDFKKYEVRSTKYELENENQESQAIHNSDFILHNSPRIAAIQGYQWHVLNKSENWVTRGVRSEYAGSYVIERSGTEIYSGLKQIAGSVYMIRRDLLEKIGWGTSLTEDFELTLKLYEKGYKVVYTPYIQAPAEAVSTIKRLVRQRMRWAEGHSHNIKRMFTRLLFGRWELSAASVIARDEIPKQSLSSDTHGIASSPSAPRNDKKTWMPSPLSLSEKLEFLYLSPYYLQAFFFITGTLSWFLSEVVFGVRLPFWTELWGWSLVFTNFFALPLMNMVGLFLEEAEERDYLGLFSFIVLSYIVAPFQAYAAVKGFIARQEGPWFRTPKTGRITDIFTPGRFYRYVFGIFGKPAVAGIARMGEYSPFVIARSMSDPSLVIANGVKQSQGSLGTGSAISLPMGLPRPFGARNDNIPNPYLALSSAYNRFDSFEIQPRRERWIGRTLLIVSLVISILTINLASITPFGHSDSSFIDSVISKLSGDPELLSEKNNFSHNEEPIFLLRLGKMSMRSGEYRSNKDTDFSLGIKPVYASETPLVKTNLIYQGKRRVVPSKIEEQDGDYRIKLGFDPTYKPGKYTLEAQVIKDGKKYKAKKDFRWGVLVINTKKSIYRPHERIQFGFGVLDDAGRTLCDANLTMKITVPSEDNKEYVLSTTNGLITHSSDCNANSITNTPDYYAEFNARESEENYHVSVEEGLGDHTYKIEEKVMVKKNIPFDIERTSYPTRIYPPALYPVRMTVTAQEDFQGSVIEKLPGDFRITKVSDNGLVRTSENEKEFNQGVQTISWNVDWKRNQVYQLKYTVRFPDISPQLYLIGPIQIREKESQTVLFQEQRQWHVASDASSFVQSTQVNTDNTAVASKTISFTSTPTAGNLVVVAISSFNGASTATISTVADNRSNTYTKIVEQFIVTNSGLQSLWYAQNISTGSPFTVTVTPTANANLTIAIHEYTSINTSGALDKSKQAIFVSAGTAADSGATATTAQANELLFGNSGIDDAASVSTTPGTNYTARENLDDNLGAEAIHTEDQNVSATGAYKATWTYASNVNWGAQIATFKATIAPENPVLLFSLAPFLFIGVYYLKKRKSLSHIEKIYHSIKT